MKNIAKYFLIVLIVSQNPISAAQVIQVKESKLEQARKFATNREWGKAEKLVREHYNGNDKDYVDEKWLNFIESYDYQPTYSGGSLLGLNKGQKIIKKKTSNNNNNNNNDNSSMKDESEVDDIPQTVPVIVTKPKDITEKPKAGWWKRNFSKEWRDARRSFGMDEKKAIMKRVLKALKNSLGKEIPQPMLERAIQDTHYKFEGFNLEKLVKHLMNNGVDIRNKDNVIKRASEYIFYDLKDQYTNIYDKWMSGADEKIEEIKKRITSKNPVISFFKRRFYGIRHGENSLEGWDIMRRAYFEMEFEEAETKIWRRLGYFAGVALDAVSIPIVMTKNIFGKRNIRYNLASEEISGMAASLDGKISEMFRTVSILGTAALALKIVGSGALFSSLKGVTAVLTSTVALKLAAAAGGPAAAGIGVYFALTHFGVGAPGAIAVGAIISLIGYLIVFYILSRKYEKSYLEVKEAGKSLVAPLGLAGSLIIPFGLVASINYYGISSFGLTHRMVNVLTLTAMVVGGIASYKYINSYNDVQSEKEIAKQSLFKRFKVRFDGLKKKYLPKNQKERLKYLGVAAFFLAVAFIFRYFSKESKEEQQLRLLYSLDEYESELVLQNKLSNLTNNNNNDSSELDEID